MSKKLSKEKVIPVEVNPKTTLVQLIDSMSDTGFQGRKLAEACKLYEKMLQERRLTIIMGYGASLSVAGQWKIISWLLEMHYIDVLVATGANISEDMVNAMGYSYYKGEDRSNDEELFKLGFNRYYDVLGKEKEYLKMTELIADFMTSMDTDYHYTTREFLYQFGTWLNKKNIHSIVSIAAKNNIPVYCPAIADSPFGDAALIAKSRGVDVVLDSVKDYVEFMGLAKHIKKTGVFYIGGGVPKDFIQLFAVTPDLLFKERILPNRKDRKGRMGTDESYYPHQFAIQITTDSPQWGGLSGCSFDEAISWGKEEKNGNFIQCFCDATIALPIMMHYISQTNNKKRAGTDFSSLFEKKIQTLNKRSVVDI